MDQERNSSNAVEELPFIELPSICRRSAIGVRIILSNAGTSVDKMSGSTLEISRSRKKISRSRKKWAIYLQSFGSA
jgi:hypothetical protein